MKRILRIALIVFVSLTLFSCKAKKEERDDIYIFFTSDVHCGVEENLGLASVKAVVDDAKAEHPYVSLVDCGDFLQGGAMGSLSKGKLIVDLMNAMDYDLVTYGNHEFDYGVNRLDELHDAMEFKPLAANVIYTGSQKNIFENIVPYEIVEYGPIKVGYLGLLTPKTITNSTPTFFMEDDRYVYDFYSGNNGEDLAARTQELVDEMREKGADYVVVISHLGARDNGGFDSISLIARTQGIDAVLDGHAHLTIVEDRYPNKNGDDVLLSSVGTKLSALGELIIAKDGSLSSLHISEYNRQDEEIIRKIGEANDELAQILNQKITDLDHDILICDEAGIRMSRSRETTAGNLVADAYRWIMDTQISLANGGAVRASLNKGEVLYQNLLDITPFQNTLASCYATGQAILDALEYGAQNCEGIYKLEDNAVGEYGGFLQVSGLKYTIDTSIPTPVVKDENGMLKGFEGERKVKDVYVLEDGEYVPIDPEKTYSVSSTSYVIFEGGDGNTALLGSEPITREGPVDVNAMIEYVTMLGDLTGRYTATEGRIIIE